MFRCFKCRFFRTKLLETPPEDDFISEDEKEQQQQSEEEEYEYGEDIYEKEDASEKPKKSKVNYQNPTFIFIAIRKNNRLRKEQLPNEQVKSHGLTTAMMKSFINEWKPIVKTFSLNEALPKILKKPILVQ